MEDMKNACDAAMMNQKRKYIEPQYKSNYLKTPEIEHLRKAKLAASWKYQKAKKQGSCEELRLRAKQTRKELQQAIRYTKSTWNQKIALLVENMKRSTIHEDVKVIDRNNIFGKAKPNSLRTATNSKIQIAAANQNLQYHIQQRPKFNRYINVPPAASMPYDDKKSNFTYFDQSYSQHINK